MHPIQWCSKKSGGSEMKKLVYWIGLILVGFGIWVSLIALWIYLSINLPGFWRFGSIGVLAVPLVGH